MLKVKKIGSKAFKISESNRIIKAPDVAAWINAEKLMSTVYEEKQKLDYESAIEYKKQLDLAFKSGLANGEKEASERICAITLETQIYLEKLAGELAIIAANGVEKVIGESADEEVTYQIIKKSLVELAGQKRITLKVSPENKKYIESKIETLLAQYVDVKLFVVEALPHLARKNGCILECELGSVDALLETQLEAIANSLTRAMRPANSSDT